MTEIENILNKDPLYRNHVVEIHFPKYGEHLWKVDSEILKKDSHVKTAVKWINEYIGFPLIEDTFSSNPNTEYNLRRVWKEELVKRHGEEAREFLNRNKLRTCVFTSLKNAVWIIDNFVDGEMPKLDEEIDGINCLINNAGEHGCKYKKMEIDKRINFIREMEDRTYGILWELRED
jgi:hypothetical protein